MKTVRDVLQHKGDDVWSIGPIDTVYAAIEMMADRHVGALPVMLDGQMVGIVSERDYARKVILEDKSSKQTRVSEIMTRDVVSVSTHERVEDCVALMNDHHVRHLPVVEDGVVIGMLSSRDLFGEIIDEQASTIDHLEHYIRGQA